MLFVAVVVAIVVAAVVKNAAGSFLNSYCRVGCAGCLVDDHFLVVGLIAAVVGFAEKVG